MFRFVLSKVRPVWTSFSDALAAGATRGLALVKRRGAAPIVAVVGVGLVGARSAHATSTYSGAMPSGMQPTDIIAAVMTEAGGWVPLAIGAIVALTIICALVFGLTRKAAAACGGKSR